MLVLRWRFMVLMFRNSLTVIMIVIGFLCYSCRQEVPETKTEVLLNSPWKFRKTESNTWYPAHVPGSIASDIALANSKGSTVIDVSRIHKTSWEYLTNFDVDNKILAYDVVQLCFKGLGPTADVYLNDSLLIKSNNRFRPSINCKHYLKAKGNQLKVLFHHGRKAGYYQNHNKEDSFPQNQCPGKNSVMRSDIGIYRPIYIEAWSAAKIDDINLTPDSVSQKKAVYSVQLSLTSIADQDVHLELLINNKPLGRSLPISLKTGDNIYKTGITIEKPKLWWPNGMGNPNLYTITVRLKKGQSVIQEKQQKIGIRTIELVNRLNSPDHSCYMKLNGIPLFLKGAGFNIRSFLPYDSAKSMYTKAIENAKESNFNMLRISNKEIYDDIFYDLCDEQGILIWQDLQVNDGFTHKAHFDRKSMKSEMMATLKHIRKHPCVALWWLKEKESEEACCENKNLSHSATKEKPLISNQNTDVEFLSSLVKEYGSSIPYVSEMKTDKSKNIAGVDLHKGQMMGNIVLNYGIEFYETFGTQGNNITKENVQQYFTSIKNPESAVYLSYLAQSEMMKSIIENHRINMPRCMGSIYEQMNDNSNALFVSTIDSYGKWTPAQYAVKNAFSHILVAPVREKNNVNIYAVSDAFKNLDAILLVRLIDFKGKDIFVRQIPVEIEANSSSILMSLKETELLKNVDRTQCCLVMQLNQATKMLSQNILYFTEFKNLKLPKPLVSLDVNEAVKGYNIILKSPVLVKSVFIQTFAKECLFSDNNFDLLPGKRIKIHVAYGGTKEELLKDIRIRSFADIK